MSDGEPETRSTWLERLERGASGRDAGQERAEGGPASAAEGRRRDGTPASANGFPGEATQTEGELDAIVQLREEAVRAAREDAAAGVPHESSRGPADSELALRDRCLAFLDRWSAAQRRRLQERLSDLEQSISQLLDRASLALDRFERLTNEIVRLKARLTARKREVADELASKRGQRPRGLPTGVYLSAISFLGVVEFFANAPVFSALLPRDPLTERQIRLVAETSQGWLAGAERVLSHLILRPDAALLAAGVVTFLCVLAHFFGHSLRELVMQRDREAKRRTVTGRSPMENLVPMILSGLGLLLVLGVLYEARVTLGDVGEEQYAQDIQVVEELRRQAGWLRVDGDLLAANEHTNRADDMEQAAVELREYASSMSRLSFPILLLNMTLVLCAISAAYFHRRDSHREHFNETPFEEERQGFVESAEATAQEVADYVGELTRRIGELQHLLREDPAEARRNVVRQLESVVALYRAENGRARGVDTRSLPAFAEPVRLVADGAGGRDASRPGLRSLRSPEEYEAERAALRSRFEEVRRRFNEATQSW